MRLAAPRLNLRARLAGAFGLVVLSATGVSALAYANTVHDTQSTEWVRHTLSVIDAATQAELTVEDMESSYREYLLTGSPVALASYQTDASRYGPQLQALAGLTADNPPQVERWRALAAQIDQLRTDSMAAGLALRQQVSDGSVDMSSVVRFDAAGNEQQVMATIRDRFAEATRQSRRRAPDRLLAGRAAPRAAA